jgi:XTP/dITP diphosphohydrolase
MLPSRLLIATRSRGKLRELRPLFESHGLTALDLDGAGLPESEDEPGLEIYETFEENALAKARHFHARAGVPTVADDSGLVVDALGGAPGVRSKRWSGRPDLSGQALDDENNRLLLERLAGLPAPDARTARYVCAAAYVDDVRELVHRGEVRGRILDAPRGAGGFGYDPYFYSAELQRTFAEVSGAEKERVSHRGRAVRALVRALMSEAGPGSSSHSDDARAGGPS